MFRPITDRLKCVFVYEEDWEGDNSEGARIILQQHHTDSAFDSDPMDTNLTCDYSAHEYTMDVESGSDLLRCIAMCQPGAPIHFNSPFIMLGENASTVPILVLDFYNQNPTDCPMDAEYISVCGSLGRDQCMQSNWGFNNSMTEVDLSSSDVDEFVSASNQSLRVIGIIPMFDVLEPKESSSPQIFVMSNYRFHLK